jgi:hypothetical protein
VSDTDNEDLDAVVFDSSRRFQVWLYTVSHAQLLLRSVKASGQPTRIDLLFKNVHALDLPTTTEGLAVRRDGAGFALTGQGWSGSITADAFFNAEDDLEYHDPSPFADNLPRPPISAYLLTRGQLRGPPGGGNARRGCGAM